MEKIGILQGHKTPKKGQQGVHWGLKHCRPSSGVSYLVVKLQNAYCPPRKNSWENHCFPNRDKV